MYDAWNSWRVMCLALSVEDVEDLFVFWSSIVGFSLFSLGIAYLSLTYRKISKTAASKFTQPLSVEIEKCFGDVSDRLKVLHQRMTQTEELYHDITAQTVEAQRRLNTIRDPPTVTSVSDPVQVLAGSSVTLNCSADGNPSPVFSWSFSPTQEGCGEPRPTPSPEYKPVGSGSELELASLKVSQTGLYRCTARNTEGKDRSTPVQLNVHAPLKQTTLSVGPDKEKGKKMTCQSYRAPPPEMVLKKNGVEQDRQTCTNILSHSFSLNEVKKVTEFECEATNEYGKDKMSVTVHPIGSDDS